MSETTSTKTNISSVNRVDISKDIDTLYELSLLMIPKGIQLKKVKTIIEKAYGISDLSKKEIDELPKYEDLSIDEILEFQKKQRHIAASCLTAEIGQEIHPEDDRLHELFLPEKTLLENIDDYAKGGFLNKINFNRNNFYKKQEISELCPFYLARDIKSKPIFTDFEKMGNISLFGELGRIKQTQSLLLKQQIENNMPFILIRENKTEDAISNEEINKISKANNYSPNIKIVSDIYPVDLFNIEHVIALFKGTSGYIKLSEEDRKKIDLVVFTFIEIQKSRFSLMFNKNQYFLDLMEFDKLFVKASGHLYNLEEHLYFEISKKASEGFDNIKSIYASIVKEFLLMAKEIYDFKDNLEHAPKYNIYDELTKEMNAEKASFIFNGISSVMSKQLLNCLLNDIKNKSNRVNILLVIEEGFEELSDDKIIAMSSNRSINVISNVNYLVNGENREVDLANTISNSGYTYYYETVDDVIEKSNIFAFSKTIQSAISQDGNFIVKLNDKKPTKIK